MITDRLRNVLCCSQIVMFDNELIGGFSFELSEGDIICVMSQWGEVEDINLVRDKETNKSRGFAFIKYEDQRSTILAVDNFNGIKLLGD